MNLHQYLKDAPWGAAAKIASACHVTPARISQVRKTGACGADLALAIEAATEGKVDAAGLSGVVARIRKPAAA